MGGPVLYDRVKETSTITGTGTLTLLGAQTGFRTFTSVLANGDLTFYVIQEQSGAGWEVGIGTFTASGTTIARTTVLASSNGGAAVNFGAGTKDVFLDIPANALLNVNVLSKSAIYTATLKDFLINCDVSGGGFTVTLPTAARKGMIIIKKVDSSANAVTIAAAGSDDIDGAASITILSQYSSYTLVSDGTTHWWVV